VTEWIEDIKLKEVGCIDAYQSQDAMLCCIFANKGKNIVTGGKDKTVRVYDAVNGKLICAIQGHKASICSISNHDDYISTGGDNGCSALIVW
jgi:WD40 repeat protein